MNFLREALNAAFDEVDASCSRVDPHPQDPPAHVYVWHSRRFGRRMYLKFKLKGNRKKPVLWLYSCQEAYF